MILLGLYCRLPAHPAPHASLRSSCPSSPGFALWRPPHARSHSRSCLRLAVRRINARRGLPPPSCRSCRTYKQSPLGSSTASSSKAESEGQGLFPEMSVPILEQQHLVSEGLLLSVGLGLSQLIQPLLGAGLGLGQLTQPPAIGCPHSRFTRCQALAYRRSRIPRWGICSVRAPSET